MIILGVDPGFDRMGCAVLEKKAGQERLLYSVCIETKRGDPPAKRLNEIGAAVRHLLDDYRPDLLAIEKLFFAKNRKTGVGVAEARGAILAEAGRRNVPTAEYAPAEIKLAVTGDGRADKTQVARMVEMILKCVTAGKKDDEVDAIAVALSAATRGYPQQPLRN